MDWEIDGHLEVKGGRLAIGGLDAESIADEFGTPLYVYDGDRIVENYRRIRDELEKYADRDVRVHYAAKANTSHAILKILSDEGALVDVVSPVEAELALKAGFSKEKIMFTGTSVSNDDLKALIGLGVLINIDSFSQMRRLSDLGKFPVSIRWNPGEGAGHHDHVITAGKFIKFGIPEDKIVDAFREAVKLGHKPVGVHQHIGSGWLEKDVDVFLSTVQKTLDIYSEISDAVGSDLEFLDFGGGPGIPYKPSRGTFPMEKYAKGLCGIVANSKAKFGAIAVEPGRYIVGDSGILLTRVNTVEEKGIPIAGVDSGFNTLIRPALYNAYHHMVVCSKADQVGSGGWMIAGNLCESTDVFNQDKKLIPIPDPDEGDVIAFLHAGAYGFAMGSRYNGRGFPSEVMVRNGIAKLIRKRDTVDEYMHGQTEY
ncbi:MAG TPA: diaminopimelate decarboxylase [bacterium]|jgi:diaminopimelate decarboxylase